MNRYDRQYREFASMFVDCVTIRPFLNDLLRLKRTMAMFDRFPDTKRPKDGSDVAA